MRTHFFGLGLAVFPPALTLLASVPLWTGGDAFFAWGRVNRGFLQNKRRGGEKRVIEE